jgi:hypothetical protein
MIIKGFKPWYICVYEIRINNNFSNQRYPMLIELLDENGKRLDFTNSIPFPTTYWEAKERAEEIKKQVESDRQYGHDCKLVDKVDMFCGS